MPESGFPISLFCCCGGYASLQGMVTFILALVFVNRKNMKDKANWMLRLGALFGGVAMIGILLFVLNFVEDIIMPADLLILVQLVVMAFLSGFGIGAIVGYIVAEIRSRRAVTS